MPHPMLGSCAFAYGHVPPPHAQVRLGLWGPGTYFKNFAAIEAILYQQHGGSDGVAGALEMFAVQLKSSGAYLARNLGLRGVDFHLEVAKLTPEQRTLYDECAEMWVGIMRDVRALIIKPPAYESIITSAQVKFFQQLVLSFKVRRPPLRPSSPPCHVHQVVRR